MCRGPRRPKRVPVHNLVESRGPPASPCKLIIKFALRTDPFENVSVDVGQADVAAAVAIR